jgi:hypothetical protein
MANTASKTAIEKASSVMKNVKETTKATSEFDLRQYKQNRIMLEMIIFGVTQLIGASGSNFADSAIADDIGLPEALYEDNRVRKLVLERAIEEVKASLRGAVSAVRSDAIRDSMWLRSPEAT